MEHAELSRRLGNVLARVQGAMDEFRSLAAAIPQPRGSECWFALQSASSQVALTLNQMNAQIALEARSVAALAPDGIAAALADGDGRVGK